MNHKSNPKDNFTTIPNAYLHDPGLGVKEKGVLTLLLSMPENWNINFKWLASVNKDGVYSVRSTVSNLETAGYIHKEAKKNGCKFAGIEYHYFDRPISSDEFALLMVADQKQEDIRANVTPPEEYPNRQEDLPFQMAQDDKNNNVQKMHILNENVEVITQPSSSAGEEEISPIWDESTVTSIAASDVKTRMRKTAMRETAPIINTDITNTEGTTATAPARKVDPILQAEPPKQQPQSYPATSDINFLLDLIPERFSNPMTDALINRSLSSHTAHQIADAIVYASDHVKGGKMQFKAYLDKCLRGGFADGYQAAREVPDTSVMPFGAMSAGRYPNGSITGNSRTDSNLQAAAMFLQKMGVQ